MGYFRRGLSGGFAADGSVIPNAPKNTGIVPPGINTGIVPPGIPPVVMPTTSSASIFTPKNLLIGGAILAIGYLAAGSLLLRK